MMQTVFGVVAGIFIGGVLVLVGVLALKGRGNA